MNKPRADKSLSENTDKDNFGKADLNDHTYAKSYKKSMAVDPNDSVKSDSYESESDETIQNKKNNLVTNKTDTSDGKTSQ